MKRLINQIFLWAIVFVVNFIILYYFGTKDLGLCGSIAFITANLWHLIYGESRNIFKQLIPSFQEIDNNTNRLFEICREYEEKIEELSEKINQLENEISELTDKYG